MLLGVDALGETLERLSTVASATIIALAHLRNMRACKGLDLHISVLIWYIISGLCHRGYGIMFATPRFIIYSTILTISTMSVGALGQVNGISDEAAEFRELMWEDLMSQLTWLPY